MKVRSEFVTNSSSTSFGASFGDALLAIFLGLGLGNLDCGGNQGSSGSSGDTGGGGGSGDSDLEDEALKEAMNAAAKAAQDAADAAMDADAIRDQIAQGIIDAEEAKLAATASKLQSEIDAYVKQWEDAKTSADPADASGTDAMNKQYQDYIDYLKQQQQAVQGQQYQIQTVKAEIKNAEDAKNDWVKQQQHDYVQVQEQKAFLEAIAKGYGSNKDYNIEAVNKQLEDLNKRSDALKKTLQSNNADISYTPRDRGEIGPDPKLVEMKKKHEQEMKQLQDQIKKEKDDRRREELKRIMDYNEMKARHEAGKGACMNVITKGLQVIETTADILVEGLSHLTGPVGKTIKAGYKFGKGVGGGLGQGMATGEIGKELVKGTLKGTIDAFKDPIKDKYGLGGQSIYIVGSETGKAVVGTVLDGKYSAGDIAGAAVKGVTKGSTETLVNVVVDKLPSVPLSKLKDKFGNKITLDYGDNPAKEPLTSVWGALKHIWSGKEVTHGNPYMQAAAKGVFKAGTDFGKGWLKGDYPITGFPFKDPGPNIPKTILEGAGKLTGTAVNNLVN